MKEFIEVTVKGKEQAINVNHIIQFVPFEGKCKIVTTQYLSDQHKIITVDESYDEIKRIISL